MPMRNSRVGACSLGDECTAQNQELTDEYRCRHCGKQLHGFISGCSIAKNPKDFRDGVICVNQPCAVIQPPPKGGERQDGVVSFSDWSFYLSLFLSVFSLSLTITPMSLRYSPGKCKSGRFTRIFMADTATQAKARSKRPEAEKTTLQHRNQVRCTRSGQSRSNVQNPRHCKRIQYSRRNRSRLA